MIRIETFTVNPFGMNCYLIYNTDTKEAAIVDCGCGSATEEAMITDFIYNKGLKLTKAINTHLHIDHVLGLKYLKDTFNLSVIAHKGDISIYNNSVQYAAMLGMSLDYELPIIKDFVIDGECIELAGFRFEIIHVPGHSPGSICLYCSLEDLLFVCDVLFYRSIGRTDLWGGNHEELIKGIKERLFTLPDKVVVYSGHGPTTTIGEERVENPYVN